MQPPRRYHSIIIGIDDLDHPGWFSPLSGCVNDALAFHAFVHAHLPIDDAHSQLLLAPRAGRSGPLPGGAQDARADTIRAAIHRTAEAWVRPPADPRGQAAWSGASTDGASRVTSAQRAPPEITSSP